MLVGDKPYSQACENNKAPILAVLQNYLYGEKTVLEIGSGTGQHAAYFAEQLPHIQWQTSDLLENHVGIQQWLDDADLNKIYSPIVLDVRENHWPTEKVDVVFTANSLHIMSVEAAHKFMVTVGNIINNEGYFIAYGPFKYDDQMTSLSNEKFDVWLKQQNPLSGIRDFDALNDTAHLHNLQLVDDVEMPANNHVLVWQKTNTTSLN